MKRLFQLLVKEIKRLGEWIANIRYRDIARNLLQHLGDLMHRALFNVLLPKKYRSLTKLEIYTIIFKSDTPRGKKFDVWLLVAIAVNILVIMLESIAGAPSWFVLLMRIIGWLFTILFTFEFYLRIYCITKPKRYLFSLYGIVDIISIFPSYLSLLLPGASTLSVLRLLRMLRIFRIYRMERFIDESRFLMNALRRSAVKVLVFMLFVFIMAIILGATMYGIENGKNPDISSIPRGVYWAVVTITTVGYGDIAPVTAMGQFISMIVMLLGYAIIAVPTGIVAGDTITEYQEQKKHRRRKSHTDRQLEAEDIDQAARANQNLPTAPEESAAKRKPWDDDPGAELTEEDLM